MTDKPVKSAGTQPEAIYSRTLPRFRAKLRSRLLRWVEWETPYLARLQTRCKHPWLDAYVLFTAAAGSHMVYMLGLPFFFWFGHPALGREFLYAFAWAVYATSWCKDFLCLPRPFSPPLTRLTVSNHALEYGWPSTHSASALVTLYPCLKVLLPRLEPPLWHGVALSILLFYVASVILGRLYSGMHSTVDCVTGALIGLFGSVVTHIVLPSFDRFCQRGDWTVPATLGPIAVALITSFPQPVDNCPCFEDAVAFIAVWQGIAVGTGHASHDGHSTWSPSLLFFIPNILTRILVGTLTIFVWRIVMKKTMHAILPPIFRLVSPILELPRRHYRKASDYITYEGKEANVKPATSLLDLSNLPSAMRQVEPEDKTMSRARSASTSLAKAFAPSTVHYDADVLTKLVVYTGIGYLAAHAVPQLFIHLGLST